MPPIIDTKVVRSRGDQMPIYVPNNSKQHYDYNHHPTELSLPAQFCQETSLHGLKYLGQPGRHLFDRVFWLVAFIASVAASVFFIWRLYKTYQETPIVTVFNPKEILMNQIPFPSVTVCNVNSVRKSKVEEYKSQLKGINKNLSDEVFLQTLATLLDINHICGSATTFLERFHDEPNYILNDLIDQDTQKLIFDRRQDLKLYSNPRKTLAKGSQSCEEMILLCSWLGETANCSDLFHPIDTDYGRCCAFNSMPISLLMKYTNENTDDPEKVKEWENENLTTDNLLLHSDTNSERKFPRRQLYPGRPAGLSVLLEPDLNDHYCSYTDSEGFEVSLNLPLDFPRMKDNGNAIPISSEVFIGVKPSVTISASNIDEFELKHRQCYFGKDLDLPHYSQYTTLNCMNECIANETFRRCGCIPYFMPGGYNGSHLCEPSYYKCTWDVRKKIYESGLNKACQLCLPSCTDIYYTAETTSLPINKENVDKIYKQQKYANFTKPNEASILHIYFNVDSVYPRLRKEYTTKIELLSNAGGLLGLCMGFSVLSLLEIIYYCSRVACRLFSLTSNHDKSTTTEKVKTDSHFRVIPQSKKAHLSGFVKRIDSRTVTVPFKASTAFSQKTIDYIWLP